MKSLLSGLCDAVERWLPAPVWAPAWQSDAAKELANTEQGAGLPWGENPVRTVYIGVAGLVFTTLSCLRALAESLTEQTTPYVPNVLTRAAQEAAALAFWLLEPNIGARRRVIRFLLVRAESAYYLERTARKIGPDVIASDFGETSFDVRTDANLLCLDYRRERINGKWTWTCENEYLPGLTERAEALEKELGVAGNYGVYSASAHAQLQAMTAVWKVVPGAGPGDKAVLVPDPDRVAVWAAVLASARFAETAARRALELLGYNARLIELERWVRGTFRLIKQMDLPTYWRP
jgi:hypothetical protein